MHEQKRKPKTWRNPISCSGAYPVLWGRGTRLMAAESGYGGRSPVGIYISASNRGLKTEQQWRWWVLKIRRWAHPLGSRKGGATWGRLEKKMRGLPPLADALGHGLYSVGAKAQACVQ